MGNNFSGPTVFTGVAPKYAIQNTLNIYVFMLHLKKYFWCWQKILHNMMYKII